MVGPTASGKSAVALHLAERIGGEIVPCDSVQVYRGFEVGAAKPTDEERRRVPHHLLDIADWHEVFDAERYRTLAMGAIEEIRARGKTPVLCGGTGLYLRALRWGLARTPPADPVLRARLQAEEVDEPGRLYARLRAIDPDTAVRTEPNNLVHIIRALEIYALTGEPASVVRGRHGFSREEMPMRVRWLSWDNQLLRNRIAERTAAMLRGGLCDEVAELLACGVDPTCRPMRAVGYREVVDVLQGREPAEQLAERIQRSTWDYARRQRTWFRKEREAERREMTTEDELERLAEFWVGEIKP